MEIQEHNRNTVQEEVASGSPPVTWRSVSNLLSLLRIVLVVPTAFALWYQSKTIAVVLFVLAAATDYLDGFFARRLNQISDLGKILDPLADKIYVAVVVLLLLILNVLPLWFVAVVLARDVLILVGGLYVEKRTTMVLPSNWVGKWAVGALSLTVLLIYLDAGESVTYTGITVTLAMLAWSSVLYAKRMVEVLPGR